MNPDFLGALLIGLVGAGHCMGMCGGIASLLSLGSSSSKSSPTIPLFYNLGRLSSYAGQRHRRFNLRRMKILKRQRGQTG